MTNRFKLIPVVSVILIRNDTILLVRQAYGGNDIYTLVGGHVDGNETMRMAAVREAYEEVGITIDQKDLKFVHVNHTKREDGQELVWFFFLTDRWQEEPYNKEPHKLSSVDWFPLCSLPDSLRPSFLKFLLGKIDNNYYSEFGW